MRTSKISDGPNRLSVC